MAAGATSNADQVNTWVQQVITSFNFDLTLEATSMGENCAHLVADGIMARSAQGRGADGEWPPNREPYRSWKHRKYGVDMPNIRTGQMLSLESLLGTVSITTSEVGMEYGTATAPTRSSASSYFNPKTDGAVTDRQKAGFNSDKRPFYELDAQIADEVFQFVSETLDEHLARV